MIIMYSRLKKMIPGSVKHKILLISYDVKRIIAFRKRIETDYSYKTYGGEKCHSFFGYYDITPFNKNNRFLYLDFFPESGKAQIVLSDLKGNRQIITETNACNWQQGCRLRWFPGSDKKIVFNDFDEGRHISRIFDIDTRDVERYEWPLYDISTSGDMAVTLDFTRLGYLRPGYGYTNLPFESKGLDLLEDGVDIVSLKEKRQIKRITYREIAHALGKSYDNIDNWYLNHLCFSPEGDKFIFFFLEKIASTGSFNANLLCYDIKHARLMVLDSDYCPSHYVWTDNENVLCTASYITENEERSGYFSYNSISGERKHVCPNSLKSDGHPSLFKTGRIITDTYPDIHSYQTVYEVDIESDIKKKIVGVYNWRSVCSEQRTDLHPRFNIDKSLISFDANFNGRRRFVILEYKNK